MKSWLAKFKISLALDAEKPLPASLRQKIARDPELKRFARRTQFLGTVLRGVPPSDPSLHDSIMRAVRAAAVPAPAPPRRAPVSTWLAASAAVVAALAVVCFWPALPRQTPLAPRSLDGAVMVLQMSEELPGAMPSLVLAPLSNEWAQVDHDLQNTTQVLLASFP